MSWRMQAFEKDKVAVVWCAIKSTVRKRTRSLGIIGTSRPQTLLTDGLVSPLPQNNTFYPQVILIVHPCSAKEFLHSPESKRLNSPGRVVDIPTAALSWSPVSTSVATCPSNSAGQRPVKLPLNLTKHSHDGTEGSGGRAPCVELCTK